MKSLLEHIYDILNSEDNRTHINESKFESRFWYSVGRHIKALGDENPEKAEKHWNDALEQAKNHFDTTGNKIDVGGVLDGAEDSKYLTHGDKK